MIRLRRRDEKQRGEQINQESGMHAEPSSGNADQVRKNTDKGFPNDVWRLSVYELRLDQVPQDVGVQSDKQQRVERHHHSKQTDGQRIRGVLPHHRRWKRNEGLEHQKDRVQPHHTVVGMTGQPENVVVVQPELANNDEADQPTQELRKQIKQL